MGSTEKILGFSSMKGLFVLQFVALGFAMPQQEPIEPRQLQPRGICANLPGFVGSLNRIVGGQDAPSPIPWQVSVRTGQDGGRHYCGGTILDSRTILCAAHCFPDKQIYNTYIMAGNVNRYKGENIAVSDIRFYDAAPWNSNTMDNDIVILKLAKPLNLGGSIQAACLPSPGFVPSDGSQCMVSGWGALESGNRNLPTILQWVTVPIVNQNTCDNNYRYEYGITSNMICAGYSYGGQDSCQGDSGGPFICKESGKPVITGIVSFGIGCARGDKPGVYTYVPRYLNWIKQQMDSGNGGNNNGPIGSCSNPDYKGDGNCDDGNNNAGCDFDGGDCCKDTQHKYCSECACKEGGCSAPDYRGDGHCDDGNNNAGCDFDGGDCCRDTQHKYCTECACKEY